MDKSYPLDHRRILIRQGHSNPPDHSGRSARVIWLVREASGRGELARFVTMTNFARRTAGTEGPQMGTGMSSDLDAKETLSKTHRISIGELHAAIVVGEHGERLPAFE